MVQLHGHESGSRRGREDARQAGDRSVERGASAKSGGDLLRLQQAAGNQAVQRLIADRSRRLSVQRNGPTTAVRRTTITLDLPTRSTVTLSVGTVAELLEAYDDLDSELFFADSDVMPDEEENPHWEAYANLRDEVEVTGEAYVSYARTQGEEPADPEEIRDLQRRVRSAERIARVGYNDYRRRLERAIARARRSAEAAERKSQNALRAAFLSGASESHPHLKFLWGIADKTQGLVTDLAGALSEEGTAVRNLSSITSRTFGIINVVTSWEEATPGTFGTALEGMSALRNAWSAGSTAASFAGVPLGLVTGHIGPALEAIDKALGKLAHVMREHNDEWVRFDGRPANPRVEPGGARMWNYMVGVMQASSAAEAGAPTGGVYDYFDNFRERFDRFNRERARGRSEAAPDSMPTETRWLFLTYADPRRLGRWIFQNRHMVWVSLYGSRPYENARRLSD